ncbi:hypothetical protein C3B55_00202 [Candidatus Pseudomonas adelgestsugas]|uniref:Uncharacterized protein n=1 Tax=Candidatus Pseudomonas adelgestsugas TaxID=1302376 RepID=A0ABX5R7D9_9PSED|nr:hypothetical protein C3B55_00202 [Candidatus Pseudomonas adelgestsugas]
MPRILMGLERPRQLLFGKRNYIKDLKLFL